MKFWLECTRAGAGTPLHINLSLVGAMWRDGDRTILEFVGNGQRVEVTERPDQLLQMHLGPQSN